MRIQHYLLLLVLLIISACENDRKEEPAEDTISEKYITEVKTEYAPDKRVALFDITSEKKGDTYILKGETNKPEAKKSFLSKLDADGIQYQDSIEVLPAKDLEGKEFGVIDISVANLRGEGKHSAELVTQALLGTPVKIWKRDGSWYYIQTPDNYLSWVDSGGITIMSENEFDSWKTSEKVIYQNPFGNTYVEPAKSSKTVSDIVAGSILETRGENGNFYKVKFPDGREAFVAKSEAAVYSEWLSELEVNEQSLVEFSEKMMGLPYLWGGTSAKGVDCSGYTKTIYFMNGIVIPRDASQQIREGKLVDSTGNFQKLAVGDLLFFGRKATDSTSERVVHVGMWIGNDEFIHSSGDVHISSMDSVASKFDDYNRNRYLRTKRLMGEQSNGLTYLKNSSIYYEQKTDSVPSNAK
ncbi:C40 family peptidase [Gramella sp. AN32]|uniref:NlpC/P60 family protein n=1 Tax=Christiangramia antarctica TaxID=2058158 RepID=A0ABW5WZ26_9FLAO|nr:C40 family peptidase [Gramella sp. AN32]MCM4154976.1 glycoside hydrolase [Gramella sp. AN32]